MAQGQGVNGFLGIARPDSHTHVQEPVCQDTCAHCPYLLFSDIKYAKDSQVVTC